jgi:alkylation response protein AidB-like acyl-CoA dehydrogenase
VDFELPEEVSDLREAVSAFAADHLAPGALERAHREEYPWDAAKLIADQGLLGLTIPEEKGGQGGTLLDAVIAIQSVASACPRSADVVQAGNFGPVRTFAEYATDAQRERFLPGILAGEKLISLCMSEPEAGSAVTDLTTSATKVAGGYRINGTKVFSTHSAEAEVYLVYVRFGAGVSGIGSVLVERGAEGLEVGPPIPYMNGEHWCELHFADCFVPDEMVLLGEGGFKRQMGGFNIERIGNASRSIAVGRYAFDRAVEHALTRHQFGRPIAEFQGLQWMFADVALDLECAQLLLLKAAVNADRGLPSADETAMAKLAANRAGHAAADLAVQAMGAAGFSQDALAEYCLRRTRGWRIAGGSTEILKNRLAESVFGRRFNQRAPK